MFNPNHTCRFQISSGKTDVYGQSVPGKWITERCSIVNLIIRSEKTTVRADSSASRGNAMELVADLKMLMTKNTKVSMDDIVELDGYRFVITGIQPRRDTFGRLDHVEIIGNIWTQS